jgi:eukaryotic-like serine/threonine-protein kinase
MEGLTPERWQRIRDAFERMLDASASERRARLEALRRSDTALAAEVEALLAADVRAGPLLDARVEAYAGALVADLERSGPTAESLVGQQLGAYRLLREVGRGGMGTIYLAERADGQFEQRVAVKLLRRGLDTDDLLERFLAERQILASLGHPNIARLLDGGAANDGRPYLVMEYVEGEPIDRYCDRHRLTVDQRLRLFLTVVRAVQHAHRSLVVHRDIKPANILVTAAGEVKLLDFGIAKLLAGEGTLAPGPPTRVGVRLLTPDYASPEQLRGEPITTASDVYQLGLLLYELLAGTRPYDLAGRSRAEADRLVCEQEPTPPSTVFLRAAPAATGDSHREVGPKSIARARRTTPERLRRRLQGDLDAIILQALRKEPERRDPSVEALAEDLERYFIGLPVRARRGSRAYRADKFVRRHRWSVAAASLLLLLLGGFAVAMSVQADRVARERDRAELALHQSEAVTAFLMSLFEASDPLLALGDTITARELLRRGVERARELGAQPLVEARLLDVLGRVHLSLGDHAQARPLLDEALQLRRMHLGDEHADVAATFFSLGLLTRRSGDHAAARDFFRQGLDIQRRVLGDHPDVAETLIELGRTSSDDTGVTEMLYREALEIRRRTLGPRHPLVANSMIVVASSLRWRGRYAEAEALYRESLALRQSVLRPDDPELAAGMLHLADVLYLHRDRHDEAEFLYRRALAILRQRLGDRHPTLVHGLHSLSGLLAARGEHQEAEALAREALALNGLVFGPEHHYTAESMDNLAIRLQQQGRLEGAEALRREALALWQRIVSPSHTAITGGMGGLADVLAAQGRYDESEALHREAIAIRREVAGPDALMVGVMLTRLGDVLRQKGDHPAAEAALSEALTILTSRFDDSHVHVQAVHAGLVALYESWGRPEEARRYGRRTQPRPAPAAALGWRACVVTTESDGPLDRPPAGSWRGG